MQGRWLHRYVKIATGVTIYIYTSWNDSHTQVIVLSAHSFSDVVRSIVTLDLFFVFFFIGGMGVLRGALTIYNRGWYNRGWYTEEKQFENLNRKA